jgi:hypothetical protein
MREVTRQASWEIEFPEDCTPDDVCGILEQNRLYEWSWDYFAWDIPRAYQLLDEQPATFDTLFLIRVLVARASHLMMTAPFKSSLQDVWSGIARHKLQYAAIYRHLLLEAMRDELADDLDAMLLLRGPRWFQTKIMAMETDYLRTIESICLMPDDTDDFEGYPLSCWVKGELCTDSACSILMPPAVDLAVRIEEHPAFRIVGPGRAELTEMVHKGKEPRYFKECGSQITSTDYDLKLLCESKSPGSRQTFFYGEHGIGYYSAASNGSSELIVVCADRTLVIEQRDFGTKPGPYPVRIYPGSPTERKDAHAYLVEFDNGTVDHYWLHVRAHTEREAEAVEKRQTRADTIRKQQARRTSRHGWRAAKSTYRKTKGERVTPNGQSPTTVTAGKRAQPSAATAVQTTAASTKKDSDIVIKNQYRQIIVNGYVIDFGKKYKRRQFVEFLHKRKQRTGESVFCYEHAKEDFENTTGRTLRCDRFEEDLFKNQPKEFRLLFTPINKEKRTYRLLI